MNEYFLTYRGVPIRGIVSNNKKEIMGRAKNIINLLNCKEELINVVIRSDFKRIMGTAAVDLHDDVEVIKHGDRVTKKLKLCDKGDKLEIMVMDIIPSDDNTLYDKYYYVVNVSRDSSLLFRVKSNEIIF